MLHWCAEYDTPANQLVWAEGGYATQATWTCRPRRRLRLMSFRPLLVFIRLRKPIFLARFTFDIFLG